MMDLRGKNPSGQVKAVKGQKRERLECMYLRVSGHLGWPSHWVSEWKLRHKTQKESPGIKDSFLDYVGKKQWKKDTFQ